MMDRLKVERQFHDWQAYQRGSSFASAPEKLVFRDEEYVRHESWIGPALARLGDVEGKRILDFGCGHGMAAVVLARRGAEVTALDVSHGYLCEARARAEANHAHIDFIQADAERLPFADQTFDGVWGNAVLHHLDLSIAGAELFRILRPGGIAIFCEPWGENPLLALARNCLPYPAKQRTPDERPLRRRDVVMLQRIFPVVQKQGFQLLSMLRRVIPNARIIESLSRYDDRLLTRLPELQHFCRYVVITLRR